MQFSKTCVISVSYKNSADTAACVRSLFASTVPVETVVVDTTPYDMELENALGFVPDLSVIHATENVGFGCGNNLGIDWALGHTVCEFLFLLNNDAIVLPDSIERLECAMAAHPDVGIMAPRIAYLDAPAILWYGGGEIDWRRASVYTPGHNRAANAQIAMTERDVSFATGCALFIRRSAMEKLNGFDPRFFMYEEDVEFCLRAREKQIRIRYIPQSLILHRVQGSSRVPTAQREEFWSVDNASLPFYAFQVTRNRLLNVYLHAHGGQRFTAMVFFPLMLLRRAVPFLIGGRLDAVVAMFKGIAESSRALKKDMRMQ